MPPSAPQGPIIRERAVSGPVVLVTAANERFYPGLLVSLASALGAASGSLSYAIHVIDGGLSDEHWAELRSVLRVIAAHRGVGSTVDRIPATHPAFSELPSRRGSTLTFARLAIPYVLPVPRAIYLDSDVVCLRGVEAFWHALSGDVSLVAARDPLGCLGRDRSLRRRLGRADWRLPYFNAGIVGLDLECWARDGAMDAIRRLLHETAELKYVDQTILNFVFRRRWVELDGDHNTVLTLENVAGLAARPRCVNLHYVGAAKPWLARTSTAQRYFADLLFDEVASAISGARPPAPRTIQPRSLARATRKGFWYRLHAPKRAAIYRQIAADAKRYRRLAAEAAAGIAIAGRIKERPWSSDWLAGEFPAVASALAEARK